MTVRRCAAILLFILPILAAPLALQAQTTRDTLVLGRRAYERGDFDGAIRLLPVGLTAGGSPSDTLWVGAVHMLTDALIEQGKDSLAQFWGRWATRVAPGLPIDSTVYPPRVARVLVSARAAAGNAGPLDTLANTAWDEMADAPAGRGVLRIQRSGVSSLTLVEGVGTMLPGESRTLPAGTYTLRISADGYAPLTVSREVLPGYMTVITPRLLRPGQAGGATAAASGAPRTAETPAANLPAVRGARLDAAGAVSCTLLEGGPTSCWGGNFYGQLGGGVADSSRHTPVTLGVDQSFAAVSTGTSHVCALTREGRAWCWGNGSSGELGNGQTTSSAVPIPVSGSQAFVQIASGANHTCALSAAGAAFCWGANRNGTLGNRTSTPSAVPTAIASPPNVTVTALAAGAQHTCALVSNGSTYCWGSGAGGQLGNGSNGDANTPTLVQSGAVSFRALAAGSAHTCALTAAGAAWCWGANGSGQIGSSSTSNDSPRPIPVTADLVFTRINAGEAHTCGLTADGAAYCWGAGRSGQLGNGQFSDSPRPVLVIGGHIFRALGLGTAHSCGLADDGTTWCWGSNADGQIGGLGGRGTATPTPVVARPVTRTAAAGAAAVTGVRESFSDGNYTSAPAWSVDSAPGLRIAVADTAIEIARTGTRGQSAAAGLTIPVRIPVTRATQVQFDVMVKTGLAGCGLNCASYPAVVRLRVRNSDLTESEVWYAYGDHGGRSRSLGSVVIVAKGDATPGAWLREQRFTVRDALPRADTIIQVSIGGVGADFAARFDNLMIPIPVAASLVATPDSARLTVGERVPLRAVVKDAGGTEMPSLPVTWTSSNAAVARVDSTGLVRAMAAGSAVIHARAANVADSVRVNVVAPGRRRP